MKCTICLFSIAILLASCEDSEDTLIPDCNHPIYNEQPSFELIKFLWEDGIRVDTTLGHIGGTNSSGYSYTLYWSDITTTNYSHSRVDMTMQTGQQANDAQGRYQLLMPGTYQYVRLSGGNLDNKGASFFMTINNNQNQPISNHHTTFADNTASNFEITGRSPMYYIGTDTFANVEGKFCCVVCDTTGNDCREFIGNFNGRVQIGW